MRSDEKFSGELRRFLLERGAVDMPKLFLANVHLVEGDNGRRILLGIASFEVEEEDYLKFKEKNVCSTSC